MRKLTLVLLMLAVVMLSAIVISSAIVGDDDLAGFEGVRILTPSAADSPCIGDPRTPLCAVETFMACWVREDFDLCERAGVTSFSLGSDTERHIRYTVPRISIYTEDDHLRLDRVWWAKPGNVNVEVDKSYCRGDGVACTPAFHFGYAVSRTGNGWKIESWGSNDEADEEFGE